MTTTPNKEIDGDIAVGRNATVGGRVTIRGNTTVDHDLKVKGWLDAPNIKGAGKGLFGSLEQLKQAYPAPRLGWWALVGDSLPAQLFISDGESWVGQMNTDGTPKLAGNPTIEATQLTEEVEHLGDELFDARVDIVRNTNDIADCRRIIDDPDTGLRKALEVASEASANGKSSIRRLNELEPKVEALEDSVNNPDTGLGKAYGLAVESRSYATAAIARLNELEPKVEALDECVNDADTGLGKTFSMAGEARSYGLAAISRLNELEPKADEAVAAANAALEKADKADNFINLLPPALGDAQSQEDFVRSVEDARVRLQTAERRLDDFDTEKEDLCRELDAVRADIAASMFVNANELLNRQEPFFALKEVLQLVPEKYRRDGAVITFLKWDSESSPAAHWHTYQWDKGSAAADWLDTAQWRGFGTGGSSSGPPPSSGCDCDCCDSLDREEIDTILGAGSSTGHECSCDGLSEADIDGILN